MTKRHRPSSGNCRAGGQTEYYGSYLVQLGRAPEHELRGARHVDVVVALAPLDRQRPVRQASVTPQPRSQTTMLTCAASTTSTNSALTFSGKAAVFTSTARPVTARSTAAASSTNATECGLPIDTAVTRYSRPAASSGASTTRAPSVGASAQGTAGPSRTGSPMSTVMRPSGSTSGTMGPAPVAMVKASPPPRRAELAEVRGEAADPVAAHLGLGAVRVVDRHAE